MSIDRCSICKKWFVLEGHGCGPSWLVFDPEYCDEEDAARVYAQSPCDAVESWAEDDDGQGDYSIVGGCSATVTVIREDGARTSWIVSGESVPEYTARMVTAPEGQ